MTPGRIERVWRRLHVGAAAPSLHRRSVSSVLLAFAVVWLVLLGYQYQQSQRLQTLAPGIDKWGEALGAAIAPLTDPGQAAAAIAVTSHWVNVRRRAEGRLPGVLLFELLAADGKRVWSSPALGGIALRRPPSALDLVTVGGTPHTVHETRAAAWTLRLVQPLRTDAQFLAYNGRWLLPYLLLALPVILLSVWLSMRNGLRPLQQFAHGIAQRDPDDLAPLAVTVRHRELLPVAGAIDHLLARLRGKVERERSFVQDAAHEIRTPLAVIAAQAHALAHADALPAREQARQRLGQAIDRASHLAQQLLALATLDVAQRPVPRHIDVAQAVRQWLALAAPGALERGADLALEAPDALGCTVDEHALGTIVTNLVDNALRYGHDGVQVVVDLRSDGERLTVTVSDDGPGIALADQARVFERFWRGGNHDAPGSGLGLSIVRQAAARMGATVVLVPGLHGRGVGFLVSVPHPEFRAG